MREEQLKKYWSAYTDAWKLMKNYNQVTERHITQMIEKHGDTIMNRLFCLVVWQEIRRIREGGDPLKLEQYQRAFDQAWHMFKNCSEPNDSDKFWESLINDIHTLGDRYGGSQFIRNLLIYVTLEQIENISKLKGESK